MYSQYENLNRQELLEHLRRNTSEINTFNGYVSAVKGLAEIREEAQRHGMLQNKVGSLATRPIFPLVCAPALNHNILWTHLPPDLWRLVSQVSIQTGWPSEAVLMVFLGCTNAAMRGRYILRMDDFWKEAVILYLSIFAESGSMKSHLLDLGSAPLVAFEGKMMDLFNETVHQHKEKEMALKRAKSSARADIVKYAAKITGKEYHNFFAAVAKEAGRMADAAKEHEASEPKAPRLFVDSCTDKKLIRTMPERGGGHAILQAEGDVLTKQMQDSRFDRNIFLKGYTMESYSYGTVTGGETYIQNPFLNILMIVQPYIAARMYGSEQFAAVGLTPRFTPLFVPTLVSPADNANDQTLQEIEKYNDKVTAMLERNYTQDADREIFEIKPTPEAYREIKAFQKEVAEGIERDTPDYMKAFMRKLHGTATRIAGVLHAWTYDRPEQHLLGLREIQAGISIALAISPHADFAFNPTGLCAYEDAQKVLAWVRRHKGAVFDSKQIAQYSSVTTNAKVFPALDLLEKHNILTQLITPGRPRQCAMHPYFDYHNKS
ncbi:MAG: hypothetical protein DELT_01701 [Desulfovibrio sp.]